jgi:hypothetical protein
MSAAAPPAWIAALLAVGAATLSLGSKWEAFVPVFLETFPTRLSALDGKSAILDALARAFLSEADRALYGLKGVKGLTAEQQRAKKNVLSRVSLYFSTLLNKWAFPDDGEAVAVDGCLWTRVPGGYKVVAKEKLVAGAAGIKRGRGGGAADEPSVLQKIAAHGVLTPEALWALHDTGSLTDDCGGWRQFRLVFAAPASFGKSYFAKRLLAYRSQQTIADGRGALPITTESIHVFSGTGGAGWADVPSERVYDYDAAGLETLFEEVKSEALQSKTMGVVPRPYVIILDDVGGFKGVDKNPVIDRLFTQARNINVSVVLIGQSPKGLLNPTRKSNATLLFFGSFVKDAIYNKTFTPAGVSPAVYEAWTRANFGKRNGFVFGCETEEAIETEGGDAIPFCLAAATVPAPADEEMGEAPEPEAPKPKPAAAKPKPVNAGAGAAPEPVEPLDEDSDGFDYEGEARLLEEQRLAVEGTSLRAMPALLDAPERAAASLSALVLSTKPCPTCRRSCDCPDTSDL